MLIELSIIWTIIINIILWFVIQMSFAYIITIIPANFINTKSRIYQKLRFEKDGKIYENIFKIKSWKDSLPDGAALFKKGFRKKSMVSKDIEYLKRFVIETCRAELAHWLVILFSPVFFIWNPLWAGIIMILYAFLANLPCIIAQRYNRERFLRILDKRTHIENYNFTFS
jgi:glycosyl-4,4'-diaponeurosporenoate acyltransferase